MNPEQATMNPEQAIALLNPDNNAELTPEKRASMLLSFQLLTMKIAELEAKAQGLEAKAQGLEANLATTTAKNTYTTKDEEGKEVFRLLALEYIKTNPLASANKFKGKVSRITVDDPFSSIELKASSFPFVQADNYFTRFLWHDENGNIRYASEADIQGKVLLMVRDALTCAGLGGLLDPLLEMTFFSKRPDIVVISRKALPKRIIMFVEVKSPCPQRSDAVFQNDNISYQVYSYLMVMRQLGHIDPIVCLCTFDKICMASLTNPSDNKSEVHKEHINRIRGKVTRTNIEVFQKDEMEKPDFSPTRLIKKTVSEESDITSTSTLSASSATSSESTDSSSGSHIVEPEVFYSATKSGADVFPNLVMMVLLAHYRNENKNNSEHTPIYELLQDAKVNNKKEIFIEKERTFALVTANGISFKAIADTTFYYSMDNGIPSRLSTFLLLEELGMGSSGKVFLTATASEKNFGIICAVKIYFAKSNLQVDKWSSNEDAGSESDASRAEEVKQTRDRECRLWNKLYDDKYKTFVHETDFNGHFALSLPYGTEIPEESRPQYYKEIKDMLTKFADAHNVVYDNDDVRWNHVLLDANGDLFLADLESLRNIKEGENSLNIVNKHMEKFEERNTRLEDNQKSELGD